jgi:hypothetical protein
MHRSLIATIAAASLAAAPGAALAQQDGDSPPRSEEKAPRELATEGLQKLMLALELLLQAIPQYEMPEVLENGDIIIRRVPEGEKRAIPAPDGDEDDDGAPVETLRPEPEET